jgi:DnaK suppressor protein
MAIDIDIEHFKRVLLEKERDLSARTSQLTQEAREPGASDVGDYADAATVDEAASEATSIDEVESHILVEVRQALQRIQDGTYGKCIECGRPIGRARLEAVPWTPYCKEDQERQDLVLQQSRRGTTAIG